jgi:hypothetical protein
VTLGLKQDMFLQTWWCQPLWTDTSGIQVASDCAGVPGGYDAEFTYTFNSGRVSQSSLSVTLDQSMEPSPDGSMTGDVQTGPPIAW